jgi:hypothetical protein
MKEEKSKDVEPGEDIRSKLERLEVFKSFKLI